MKIKILLIFCATIIAQNIFSQEENIYKTERLSSTPQIDGILDDECWKGGTWHEKFIQRLPNEGKEPTEKTSFNILYDDTHLYMGVICHVADMRNMMKSATRRDGFGGDCMGFLLDSYNDDVSSFEFAVTSSGVKIDLIGTDAGNKTIKNFNWDPVWEVKVKTNKDSWTIEMKIPFNQLRFKRKDIQTWGIGVWRWHARKQAEDNWPLLPTTTDNHTPHLGTLKGISGIKKSRQLELFPYVSGKATSLKAVEGNPYQKDLKGNYNIGVDGKLGLSDNFTLDFTVNPDFGQTEADPSQMNLTNFETFYEEKRQFFKEGVSTFDFKIDDASLFYSRRIGKSLSSGRFSKGDKNFVEEAENATILSAIKLNGKTKDGLTIGAIQSVTLSHSVDSISRVGSKEEDRVTVEPLTSYTVVRAIQSFNKNNSFIGGIFTSTNRKIDATEVEFMPENAFTGGLDFNHQWGGKRYFVNAKAVVSRLNGTKEAIQTLQKAGTRNFLRSNASHLDYDKEMTDFTGYGGAFNLGKNAGKLRLSAGINLISPKLDLNDIGYLAKADLIKQTASIGYEEATKTDYLISYNTYLRQKKQWDFGGNDLGFETSISGKLRLLNYWSGSISASNHTDFLDIWKLRSGPAFQQEGSNSISATVWSDDRKDFTASISSNMWYSFDEVSKGESVSLNLNWNINTFINLSTAVWYNISNDNTQFVKKIDENFILGNVDREELSVTINANCNITPTLSIQYYAQPFFSSGKYNEFKRITDPLASKYQNRFDIYANSEISLTGKEYNTNDNLKFDNPNYDYVSLKSNLVLQWEYIPGATMYLVWSHSGAYNGEIGTFDIEKNFDKLLDTDKTNVFMFKVSYWLPL